MFIIDSINCYNVQVLPSEFKLAFSKKFLWSAFYAGYIWNSNNAAQYFQRRFTDFLLSAQLVKFFGLKLILVEIVFTNEAYFHVICSQYSSTLYVIDETAL